MPANINILLIEDDQDDIELLQEALKDNGVDARYDILVQGNKIIPWMESFKVIPHIIIMDLNLPKMHGREVLCLIKKNERLNAVPVLVLTTSSQEQDKDYCMQNGADRFITKPATTEGFRNLVRAIAEMAQRPAMG